MRAYDIPVIVQRLTRSRADVVLLTVDNGANVRNMDNKSNVEITRGKKFVVEHTQNSANRYFAGSSVH